MEDPLRDQEIEKGFYGSNFTGYRSRCVASLLQVKDVAYEKIAVYGCPFRAVAFYYSLFFDKTGKLGKVISVGLDGIRRKAFLLLSTVNKAIMTNIIKSAIDSYINFNLLIL